MTYTKHGINFVWALKSILVAQDIDLFVFQGLSVASKKRVKQSKKVAAVGCKVRYQLRTAAVPA